MSKKNLQKGQIWIAGGVAGGVDGRRRRGWSHSLLSAHLNRPTVGPERLCRACLTTTGGGGGEAKAWSSHHKHTHTQPLALHCGGVHTTLRAVLCWQFQSRYCGSDYVTDWATSFGHEDFSVPDERFVMKKTKQKKQPTPDLIRKCSCHSSINFSTAAGVKAAGGTHCSTMDLPVFIVYWVNNSRVPDGWPLSQVSPHCVSFAL